MGRAVTIVLLMSCLLAIAACKEAQQPVMINSESSAVLALGDSYTIGEAVPPDQRWPTQLVARLRSSKVEVGDPIYVAQTGWTTDELAAAMDVRDDLRGRKFALVTLLIGVNNQYRGRSVNEYRAQFEALLKRAIELAGNRPSRVVVLSIPDWGVTPYATSSGRAPAQIAREIDEFNAVNREATLAAGSRYVDVTPVSRAATSRPPLIARDGLHPSGKMYSEWAELALEPTAAALGAN
jgi:lysophospholipase L1-like esterase